MVWVICAFKAASLWAEEPGGAPDKETCHVFRRLGENGEMVPSSPQPSQAVGSDRCYLTKRLLQEVHNCYVFPSLGDAYGCGDHASEGGLNGLWV